MDSNGHRRFEQSKLVRIGAEVGNEVARVEWIDKSKFIYYFGYTHNLSIAQHTPPRKDYPGADYSATPPPTD